MLLSLALDIALSGRGSPGRRELRFPDWGAGFRLSEDGIFVTVNI